MVIGYSDQVKVHLSNAPTLFGVFDPPVGAKYLFAGRIISVRYTTYPTPTSPYHPPPAFLLPLSLDQNLTMG